MNAVDTILEKLNLKYEQLTKEERATYERMLADVRQNQLSIDKLRGYIRDMRSSVEMKLTEEAMKHPSFWTFLFNFRNDLSLKARLRNYLLLEAFLDSPKKAEAALERALAGTGTR